MVAVRGVSCGVLKVPSGVPEEGCLAYARAIFPAPTRRSGQIPEGNIRLHRRDEQKRY